MAVDTLTATMNSARASAASSSFPRFRQIQLAKLYNAISTNREALANALVVDLGRAAVEAQAEVALALAELKSRFSSAEYAILMQKVKLSRTSGELRKARGLVVVVARDSAPLLSVVGPLSAAMVEGNSVVSILSSKAAQLTQVLLTSLSVLDRASFVFLPSSADLLGRIVPFKPDSIVIQAPSTELQLLLAQNGVHTVAVAPRGATVVVDRTAGGVELRQVARLIVRGKFFGLGMLDGSIESVLVQEERTAELLDLILEETSIAFGADPSNSSDYGRFVDSKDVHRISGLVKKTVEESEGKIVRGGAGSSPSFVAPTIVEGANSALLKSSIRGPVLPFATFISLEGALAQLANIGSHTLYVFASQPNLDYLATEGQSSIVYHNDVPLSALYNPARDLSSPSPFSTTTTIVPPGTPSTLFAPFTASKLAQIAALSPKDKTLAVKRVAHAVPFLRSFFPQGFLVLSSGIALTLLSTLAFGGYKGVRFVMARYLG